ncbi:hypothetical protein MA16_Dca020971 [Dendrobium catenatum]|uniref:Uncharacterized protein n=1 Tax=Dendrobium catenatum TaxID=906689 RepID=A0A2I0VFR3_9ASPA|nr:hypothetical protein MA16_Dca020971 [Dendrobium catenatum]
MSCQNSMKQRGVVRGVWLATISGAERALLSLREKAQAAACRQIKVAPALHHATIASTRAGFTCSSLSLPRPSGFSAFVRGKGTVVGIKDQGRLAAAISLWIEKQISITKKPDCRRGCDDPSKSPCPPHSSSSVRMVSQQTITNAINSMGIITILLIIYLIKRYAKNKPEITVEL